MKIGSSDGAWSFRLVETVTTFNAMVSRPNRRQSDVQDKTLKLVSANLLPYRTSKVVQSQLVPARIERHGERDGGEKQKSRERRAGLSCYYGGVATAAVLARKSHRRGPRVGEGYVETMTAEWREARHGWW